MIYRFIVEIPAEDFVSDENREQAIKNSLELDGFSATVRFEAEIE